MALSKSELGNMYRNWLEDKSPLAGPVPRVFENDKWREMSAWEIATAKRFVGRETIRKIYRAGEEIARQRKAEAAARAEELKTRERRAGEAAARLANAGSAMQAVHAAAQAADAVDLDVVRGGRK